LRLADQAVAQDHELDVAHGRIGKGAANGRVCIVL
jgi:hypothetical protein